ncbi:MAG: DNA repair protein RecN [Planctomycetota bacterium]|nr:DNA repair protein RecN [Planctomycetota bacterium]
MLRELSISNLAIIEKADIELARGLNVFTGQTGAGKSLILGALELLLGLRGGGEDAAMFVRPGAAEARVSGVFEVASESTAARLAAVLDQPIKAGEPILVTRRVLASGRSSVAVNGSPVTAAMLKQAGEQLVDIHGQHDQQFLLKPSNQLAILDAFADALALRGQFAEIFHELSAARQRLAELRQSQEQRAEQLELYRFQIDEIDSAKLVAGEYEEARNRHSVLKNATKLKAQSAQVLEGLSEGDETVLERLGTMVKSLQELVRLDASLTDLAGQVEGGRGILQDVATALGRYQDRLDVDPGELQKVEERLDVLNRLIHKYARTAGAAEDAVAAVLEHRRQIGIKAERLEQDAVALGSLDEEIAKLQAQLGTLGRKLTRRRQEGVKKLRPLVEAQFRELEMNEAAFDVQIVTRGAGEAGGDATGLDDVEFLVRTNPGQEMLPLRKIASGGEISRIMLALKTILADKDQITVLVFDEIDANIGDRLGATIGRKLRALANGGGAKGEKGGKAGENACQIICITHLSQIAACADHHLQITKDVVGPEAGRQTLTRVRVLEGEDRVRELAEMMAGAKPSETVIAHARDLLGLSWKRGRKG